MDLLKPVQSEHTVSDRDRGDLVGKSFANGRVVGTEAIGGDALKGHRIVRSDVAGGERDLELVLDQLNNFGVGIEAREMLDNPALYDV